MNHEGDMPVTATSDTTLVQPRTQSPFRAPLLKVLKGMSLGQLTLNLPDGRAHHFGSQSGEKPHAQITINDESFFKNCTLYGAVGFGESYVKGEWDTHDLRGVIEWFIHNIANNSSPRYHYIGWLKIIDQLRHKLRANSISNSKRNIAEHYDLGNEFYKLWLDPTMTYSGAKFTAENQTLESAQLAKYQAICQKLRLQKSDHLLEIGCGWGGFSCYAASTYGCKITAITISQAQFDEATKRISSAGLTDLISVRLQDYRQLSGQFDKIASIEMLEAVGEKYIDTYFAKCHEVLAPHGLIAVQMITVTDKHYADLRRRADFIQKHIFPGSLLLSLTRINQSLNRTGNLSLCELEEFSSGYARTLREWHHRFNSQLDAIHDQGFSQAFIRKWNYYLKYCEAAFATRNINLVQAVYTRPNNPLLHHEEGIDHPKHLHDRTHTSWQRSTPAPPLHRHLAYQHS